MKRIAQSLLNELNRRHPGEFAELKHVHGNQVREP